MLAAGKITQVIGSTFDAEFPENQLPDIYYAITVSYTYAGQDVKLTGEVQQHLGGGKVRAVALGTTDGLARGMEVTNTGGPVTVPVGKETLGRVFNLLGDVVDGRGPIQVKERRPIHRDPPEFVDLVAKTEIFETGIKVIDLLTPFVRGGKAGLFGGAGLGKTVVIQELIARIRPAARRLFRLRRRRRAYPRRQRPCGWKCSTPRSVPPARALSTRPSWSSAR